MRSRSEQWPRSWRICGGMTQIRTLEFDCSQVDGERMARLVQSDLAATGQPETGEPPPPLLRYVFCELDALGKQVSHRGFQVVAHEVQLVPGRSVGRVHGQFCRRDLEDQPSSTSVDMRLPENVCEEGAICFRISAEQDDMTAVDHMRRLRGGVTHLCRLAIVADRLNSIRQVRIPYRHKATPGGRAHEREQVYLFGPDAKGVQGPDLTDPYPYPQASSRNRRRHGLLSAGATESSICDQLERRRRA
jgi:hypothetical protein